jgi:hypothetical protein
MPTITQIRIALNSNGKWAVTIQRGNSIHTYEYLTYRSAIEGLPRDVS